MAQGENAALKTKLNELKQEVNYLKELYYQGGYQNYNNILIYGRMLINHVERLRKFNEGLFDSWYYPYRLKIFGKGKKKANEGAGTDKIVSFFIKARNEMEHEEMPKFKTVLQISSLRIPEDLGPRPAAATGSFVDGFGIGWLVKNPDGSSGKLYVHLPEDKVKIYVKPLKLPSELADKDINYLLKYYVDFLGKMVDDAIDKFGKT